MNAIAQFTTARNFTELCKSYFYASQIAVIGKPDDFHIEVDDLVLDAAYAWLIAGHLTDADGHVEADTAHDFMEDVIGNKTEQDFTRFVYDLLTGKETVETARRAYVRYLIETYERDHLARLQFGPTVSEEPWDIETQIDVPASNWGIQ